MTTNKKIHLRRGVGLSACGKRNNFLWFDEPKDVDCEKCLVSHRRISMKRRPSLEEILE